jgi:uncharacterized membrane protein
MNNAASTPDRRPATVEPAQESIKMTNTIVNVSSELEARVNDGSQLSTTVAAFVLMAASCLMMAAGALVGVSALTALIAGLVAPAGAYLLIHAVSSHSRRPARGKHARR